jgi:RNA polymerase sigma-70 factor (ECF subfamily)
MKMPDPSPQESGPPQATDARLVREAKRGRRESFDQLVLRYQRMVYAIIRRMVSNHEDADDLAQETFLATYRAMERLDENQSFPAYICRIAINLSINHLRRKKRWVKIWSQRSGEVEKVAMSQKMAGPHGEFERSELMGELKKAVESLPPHQKAVMVLRVYQQMSYGEIARTLKISTGTVMSRLHRARSRLRIQLKDLI